jgi:hypothetical protein
MSYLGKRFLKSPWIYPEFQSREDYLDLGRFVKKFLNLKIETGKWMK